MKHSAVKSNTHCKGWAATVKKKIVLSQHIHTKCQEEHLYMKDQEWRNFRARLFQNTWSRVRTGRSILCICWPHETWGILLLVNHILTLSLSIFMINSAWKLKSFQVLFCASKMIVCNSFWQVSTLGQKPIISHT